MADSGCIQACRCVPPILLVSSIILFFSCFIIGCTMYTPEIHNYLPWLPSFYVAFTSVTSDVHNNDHVSAKLDVALLVLNQDDSTISYNNFTASVFHDGKLLFDDSLFPFDQYGNRRNVFVSSNDAKAIHVDNWVSTEDKGKIGISYLYLELKALTRFRGRKLMEHEANIRVACDNVEVQIPSISTTTTTTRRFDPMLSCAVDHGPFKKYNNKVATIKALFWASVVGIVIGFALMWLRRKYLS